MNAGLVRGEAPGRADILAMGLGGRVQQSPEQQQIEQPQLLPEGWMEQALRELRQRNSVSPLPVRSGVTVDIGQVATKGPVYGYTASERLDPQSPDSPILVRSNVCTEFDLEVHRLGAEDLRLVRFVGKRMTRAVAPTVCYAPAAAY